MRNATVIPNGRDNTYDPTEVSRRTVDELYQNSFNDDQRTALEAKFSGGGSGCECNIPTPTVEDAGKSIVVNDEGQYALASASGGTALVVEYVSVETPLNKTWQEIRNAQEAGASVIFIDASGDSVCTSSMIKTYIDTSNNYVVLVRLFDSDNAGQALQTLAFYAESADGALIVD